MSAKDPFQQLVDEIYLIRKDMERLQRTSLDRDEASELHGYFMRDIESLRETFTESPEAFKATLKTDRDQMARNATQAATEAAEAALGDIREQLTQERQRLSQAAGEARREAWRYFGGFWVWLASIGATGALLGALAMFWLQGHADASAFGTYPHIYCTGAGGESLTNTAGERACVFWYD